MLSTQKENKSSFKFEEKSEKKVAIIENSENFKNEEENSIVKFEPIEINEKKTEEGKP